MLAHGEVVARTCVDWLLISALRHALKILQVLQTMRILLLTHSFNSLTQRLYVELSRQGHELSVEFDINDAVTLEAVALFRPHLILAPYLKCAIPEQVWKNHLCLIVHPGPVGDRGPSALDWAIHSTEPQWGVTLLQAEAEMDAGPVWASETFAMRFAPKSSLYRHEVTEAAVRCVWQALERHPDYLRGRWQPRRVPLQPMKPLMSQSQRAIAWSEMSTPEVLRRIYAADGAPGVKDELFGVPCHLFNARPFPAEGEPGQILGRWGKAIVRATTDGAVAIGHVKRPGSFKLPTAVAFPEAEALPLLTPNHGTADPDIFYEERESVGYLHFPFYNGAMSTDACERLQRAFAAACQRPTRVIVLMGGKDFFSNGIDLNQIEAAPSPAEASWANIIAMDDLCEKIITTTSHLVISALSGNAGAGGAFLALCADEIWAREGVVLNPHYKNMGNLYGSEYWTYLLPRRLGESGARALMNRRLPLGATDALEMGFIDACFARTVDEFRREVHQRARLLAQDAEIEKRLAQKRSRLARDEAIKPLAQYRDEELVQMQRNFFGFDPSYHVARYHFVFKTPHSWTPRHLARHRDLNWQIPDSSSLSLDASQSYELAQRK